MQNFRNDLDDRWADFAADHQNLPQRIGPGELPSMTRRGHMKLINDRDSRLRQLERRYMSECEDEPPAPSAPVVEAENACKVAAGAGAAYAAYRVIRLLPSLLPAAWWTIPANLAAP
ncbi:hypothetical protein [Burkholderia lata]